MKKEMTETGNYKKLILIFFQYLKMCKKRVYALLDENLRYKIEMNFIVLTS